MSANVLYCAVVQGYTELLDLLLAHRKAHGSNLPVDAYGSGEDSDDIKERAERYELNVYFLGARDHLDDSIHPYRFSPLLAHCCVSIVKHVLESCIECVLKVATFALLEVAESCRTWIEGMLHM